MSEEIRYLALENKSLQNRLADQQQQYSLKIHEVLSDLDSARKEMVSHAFVSLPFVQGRAADVLLTSQKRGGLDSARPSAAVRRSPAASPPPLLGHRPPPHQACATRRDST